MPRKNSYITVTDQFCGAGGSGQGARKAGAEVKLALNHWDRAIVTYSSNFPNALTDCTAIHACDPTRYPSTHILITSPECTKHTNADGRPAVKKQMDLFKSGKLDPAAERSRATMWDVPRFAEYHRYEIVIVEQVVEARNWIQWEAWILSMHLLGYKHKCVYLNSQFCHPTPQSRDRMYVIFWKKGNKAPDLNITPSAYCPVCEKDIDAIQTWKNKSRQFGKYGIKTGQYIYSCPTCTTTVRPYYYAAYNAIDWSDLGTRIGDRKRKLKPKTITRINNGLDKTDHLPFYIQQEHSSNLKQNINSVIYPLPTQATRQTLGLVVPFIVENKGTSKTRLIHEPLSTITTVGHHGVLSDERFKSFITYYNNGSNVASHITDPCGTFTTNDRLALVNYQKPNIEDCYYRMIKPHEVKKGMAFEDTYIITGDAKEQVKQLGNAVTPPAMELLINRCIQSLS